MTRAFVPHIQMKDSALSYHRLLLLSF